MNALNPPRRVFLKKDDEDPAYRNPMIVPPKPLPSKASTDEETDMLDEKRALLSRFIASRFVRRDGKFYQLEKPNVAISATDLKRVSLHRISSAFPEIEITDALWSAVCKHAINDTHTIEGESVSVWDGSLCCKPQEPGELILKDGLASINSWKLPDYRQLETTAADSELFDELLDRIFMQKADRIVFKDWVSWLLQNEDDKPTWAVLLYSQSKGTGKSTLGRLLSLLFGEVNSIRLNGVSKLTGRFNKTVMIKKFITCEEVKLTAGTDAGNTVKALISEKDIGVEGKGTNTESLDNVSVFLMTTNHFPHWIEPDDRRFYVIDVDHSGHASGAGREDFQAFMKVFFKYMENPENIMTLRNALLRHKQANSFDPRALNVAAAETPIMRSISQASGQVLQQVLEEMIAAQGVFAVSQAGLVKIFSENLKANPNRIIHMMNELGWRAQKVKWGGVDYGRVLWVHPDYQVSNGRVRGPNAYDQPVDLAENGMDLI